MKRAICVGLNYTGSDYALPDCDLDAAKVAGFAKDAGYIVEKHTGLFTAADFEGELVRLREHSTKSGTTLIAYSGHGSTRYNEAEQDRLDEGLCFWNGTNIEFFPDDYFRNMIDAIKGTVFVFFDSCFSGGMERVSPGFRGAKRYVPFDNSFSIFQPTTQKRTAAPGNKIYFLFASKEHEYSYSTGQGGLFTNAFFKVYGETWKQARTIKSVMTRTTKICVPDQTPNYLITGGSALKRVF